MKLSEHRLGVEWLNQFDSVDIHIARLMIDSLKLVSHSEFEGTIIRLLNSVINETKGPIALFTVSEGRGGLPGSDGRLGHIFTGIYRNVGERILINPTDEQMFEAKVDSIVLVDDFVASGTRVRRFWREWNPKRLKSWVSFKYCKLWVVGYAIHRMGLDKISEIKGLESHNIRFDVHIETESKYWSKTVEDFIETQANRVDYVPFSSNFGGIQCPLVFQHGCPDNAPAILIKNGPGFKALFPGRSINPSLYGCFDNYSDVWRNPDLLLKSGQPLLAASLVEEIASGASEVQIQILTILGILARGVSVSRLYSIMTASVASIDSALEKCRALGLIDEQSCLSPFGRDLVTRSKGRFVVQSDRSIISIENAIYYVPKQFCGVQ